MKIVTVGDNRYMIIKAVKNNKLYTDEHIQGIKNNCDADVVLSDNQETLFFCKQLKNYQYDESDNTWKLETLISESVSSEEKLITPGTETNDKPSDEQKEL